MAGSATGPFYCPADQKVYLDTSFFDELSQKFGAPGDFAAAYVIAHEVGHHVQTLLGISRQVTEHAAALRRGHLEPAVGDDGATGRLLRRRLGAAHPRHSRTCSSRVTSRRACARRVPWATTGSSSATRGYVVPDAFTHGSSQQRMRWFKQGLQTGDINSCDTFNAAQL